MSHLRIVPPPRVEPVVAVLRPLPEPTVDDLLATVDAFRVDENGVVHLAVNDLTTWLTLLPRWQQLTRTP